MANVAETDGNSVYEIKFLNESHLDQILYLQDIVKKNLSDPTSYYVEPVEFFCKQLAIEKSVIGLFQKNQLVGFHIASFPALDEDNLCVDIGLKQEELLQVVQFGPTAVHPDHRKRGLLSNVAERHIAVVEEMGYRHICLTIAPNNYPSIRATMAYGFVIKQIKLKFDNLLRYIMYLDFENPLKQPQYSVRIPSADMESQKFMIRLGFHGYDVLKKENGFDLVFGRDER